MITVISSSISVIGTLLGAFYTQVFNMRNENLKEKKKRKFRDEREKLDSIYKRLIQVISLFPRQTPLDVLRYMAYPPNYHFEHFDTINNILDIQIEDYKKRLYKAKDEYEKFVRNEKIDFELYAGDEVKNKLVIFEVLVHNAFVAGRYLENKNRDTNQLDELHWQLINSIRNDLGI